MPALIEMLVERPPAHVYEVSADLAAEFDAQTVQFVEPVGDRLAVPGERQFEGVVDFFRRVAIRVVVVVPAVFFAVCTVGFGVVGEEGVEFHLALALCHALLSFDVYTGVGALALHCGGEFLDAEFTLSDGAFFETEGGVASAIAYGVPICGGVCGGHGAAGFAHFSGFDVFLTT